MRSRILISILGLAVVQAAHAAELRAGAARVSITPDPKAMSYTLGGYGDPKRLRTPATAILDTCYARSLVLESGGRKAALVSLDLCFLPANVKDAVDSRIAQAGFTPDSVLLSCTHTHSGPEPLSLHSANNAPAGMLPAFKPELLDWIAGRIAQSITEAASHLAPAQAGSGQMENLGLNRNRRGEKQTDDEMTALKVTDASGKVMALVINYAAHPVYLDADSFVVSGDWSGALQRMAEAENPGAVALFINGAEGDASPNGSDSGAPVERIEIYAAKLLARARALIAGIVPVREPRIEVWQQRIDLPEQQPNPLFIVAAARLGASPEQAKAFVARLMPRETRLSFLRVGDALFMGFPGEPTTPVGLAAKAMARARGVKRPAVAALTNGWLGYLVTAEQYRAGKYEPVMSFYGPSIGERMLDGLRSGLRP